MRCVIVHFDASGYPSFWSGRRWVPEYPDATEYEYNGATLGEMQRAIGKATPGDVALISDYGLDTERTRHVHEVMP